MKSPVVVRVGGSRAHRRRACVHGGLCVSRGALQLPRRADGSADIVLPQLLATGVAGRAAWVLYAVLPLIWLPAGVGALNGAAFAAITMMLGLMRWPSIHWRLGELYVSATRDQKSVLSAIFDGWNVYLGNYIGEFLGEFSFSTFILLSSWALLQSRAAARWLAVVGLVTGAAGLVGMFRGTQA